MTTYARFAEIGPITPQVSYWAAQILPLPLCSKFLNIFLFIQRHFLLWPQSSPSLCLLTSFIYFLFLLHDILKCFSNFKFIPIPVIIFLSSVCHSWVLTRPMANGGAVDSHFWLKHLSPTRTNKDFSSKENLSKASFDFQGVFFFLRI